MNGFCTYCQCILDQYWETSDAIKYFSLDDVLSDVEYNKVVTGLRIREYSNYFRLEIQQGQIGELAQIDQTTLQWKSSTVYSYSYVKMSRKSMYLDDIKISGYYENYVVTGVRFAVRTDGFQLEVRITDYDFSTGKLNPYSSIWITNYESHK